MAVCRHITPQANNHAAFQIAWSETTAACGSQASTVRSQALMSRTSSMQTLCSISYGCQSTR